MQDFLCRLRQKKEQSRAEIVFQLRNRVQEHQGKDGEQEQEELNAQTVFVGETEEKEDIAIFDVIFRRRRRGEEMGQIGHEKDPNKKQRGCAKGGQIEEKIPRPILPRGDPREKNVQFSFGIEILFDGETDHGREEAKDGEDSHAQKSDASNFQKTFLRSS